MSMIIRAVLVGERVMGDVVVCMVRVPLDGWVPSWVGGWDRSKPVLEECSQKLDLEPTIALRWDGGVVGAMAVAFGGSFCLVVASFLARGIGCAERWCFRVVVGGDIRPSFIRCVPCQFCTAVLSPCTDF